MQQRCYFWRGMKTYFSSLLMMLISSHSPNMQMKCAITIKWIVLRRWGTVQAGRACLQNRDGAQLCDFVLHFVCARTEPFTGTSQTTTAPGAPSDVWGLISEHCHHRRGFRLSNTPQTPKRDFVWPLANTWVKLYLTNGHVIIISF